tara:strand:+ start:5359 stop:7554 length:2196 start_codon:yes stop_codon:yes gene_type:complete
MPYRINRKIQKISKRNNGGVGPISRPQSSSPISRPQSSSSPISRRQSLSSPISRPQSSSVSRRQSSSPPISRQQSLSSPVSRRQSLSQENPEDIDENMQSQIYNLLFDYDINSVLNNNHIRYARLFLSNINLFRIRYQNTFERLNTAAQNIINRSSPSSRRQSSSPISRPPQSSPISRRQSSSPSQPRPPQSPLLLQSRLQSRFQLRQQSPPASQPSSSLSLLLSSPKESSKIKSNITNSKTYDEDDDIDKICTNKFKKILEQQKLGKEAKKQNLKTLLNKSIKYCSKYNKNILVFDDKKKEEEKIKLKNFYTVNGNITLEITNRNNILKELFIKSQDKNFFKKFLKVRTHQCYSLVEKGLKIIFLEDTITAIDLGGPQREFIDLLTAKINNIENKIFIKLDSDIDVYMPNIFLTLEDAKNILNDSLLKLEDFYYFIGQMVFFLLKAKSGLKIKLARTLLFRMVTKYDDRTFHTDKYKILQHQYYYHYTLDSNNFATLEYYYENSLTVINELFDDIKTENDLYEYMIKTAHDGSYLNSDIIKSFIAGFHSISKNLYNYFIENKISVIELNKMLFLTELTIDKIREILIPKILKRFSEEELTNQLNIEELTNQLNIPNQLKAFIEILNDNVEFPQQFIDSEKSKQGNENKIYPKNHIEFVEFLLKYWTGSSILYETDNYKLFATLQDYQLTASTCFNQLTIGPLTGLDLEQTKKTLYELLIIESIEHGFTDN